MHSFTKLFTLVALITSGVAATVPNVDHTRCSGAKLVTSTTLHAGAHDIIQTTHSCASKATRRQYAPVGPTDVSGDACTTSCNQETGILPPISEDCDTISDAVAILAATMSPTFVVNSNHLITLTYGTCSYFFENTGSVSYQYTWSDLVTEGAVAGAACFPPHQPFSPEGLCTSYDGTWAVGATHS